MTAEMSDFRLNVFLFLDQTQNSEPPLYPHPLLQKASRKSDRVAPPPSSGALTEAGLKGEPLGPRLDHVGPLGGER